LAFFLCLAAVPNAFSQENDPARLIGMDPRAAFAALGSPQEVFAFRGAEEKQDNVVFFYSDFFYLFWFKNRVWQVRFDKRFARSVFGLSMGMSDAEVERACGRPLIPAGNSLYFDLDGQRYPLRVRLVFEAGTLSDMYVYRSDF
jgi:hypothetical protein